MRIRRPGTAAGCPSSAWAERWLLKAEVAVSTKVGRIIVPRPEASKYGHRVEADYDEAFPTQKYHNNVVVWDYRKEGVEEALRQCQRRLQRTLIDCVRVHDAESQERWQEACSQGGAVDTLVSMRRAGAIGQVSLGFNSMEFLLKSVKAFPVGTFDNIMVARTWNLLDQSAYPLLLECQNRGIRVHIAAPFCAGLLWGQSLFMYSSTVPVEATEKAKRWQDLGSSYGLSLPQLALAFAFLPACVERIAIGCASPEQVRSNVGLCGVKVPAELWQRAKAEGLLPASMEIS
ncbi:unnamed protein product [Effrenium voratum]|uniref:NADP-dependent oxidoreductase domain-containing protein n=1 Tax=Effrenium voratum TaxID=2562239 RepID=A0AA36IGS2_9DINO|nr:unnamed protein product [Effrenium voratum]